MKMGVAAELVLHAWWEVGMHAFNGGDMGRWRVWEWRNKKKLTYVTVT